MGIETLQIPPSTSFLKEGDTIPMIPFAFAATDEIDLTGATIQMQLYLSNIKVLDIETGSGITLLDSKSFEIDKIPASENDLPAGLLKGDLQVTFPSGEIKTLIDVEYNILNQRTK